MHDCVRCFSCGGGLRNWEYGDSPWEEHARWFPWCRFLIEEKGLEFVRQYQELQVESNDELPKEKIISGAEMLKTLEEDKILTNHPTDQNGDKNEFERRITSNIKEQLNEMGLSYSSERIRQEINRLKDIDHQILTTEFVITNLIDNAENLLENHEPLDVNKTEERSLTTKSVSIDNTQTNKETDNGNLPNDSDVLQEENTKLKSQLLCKICMDSDSNVVFIPCGHMVSCEKCAPHIRKCAVCRVLIKGRVKAFMS
ncbi:baculoviral IAP repeat-containing protein 7-B-like [Ruditapes philippinarum]|uniref:baculoviral IAP repeat-containing protein 7-B-like n=1 Tax=Ruditapes philippinarum TaxID=129788 RepID=UPI00295AA8DA|nr:baculoviral IAP repeat-containing protein 7-B-like [Ruditapes philippinarum]